MNVINLTVFIGLLLVAFFIGFFLYLNSQRSRMDHDSLLPLDEEKPCSAGPSKNIKG